MEFYLKLLERLFQIGSLVIFGNNGKYATLRIVIIGSALGIIGYTPLSLMVILWAIYVWLYTLWDPILREFSGINFGRTTLLCIAFASSSIGMSITL